MNKIASQIILYCIDHPIAVVIIALETIAIVLFLRYFRIQREKRAEEERDNRREKIEELYKEITNPRWVEKGGLDEWQDNK